MCQRTSHQPHYFIWAKLLKFQETFLEKFLVSGFGADAPTDNAHKKHGVAVLFIFLTKNLPQNTFAGDLLFIQPNVSVLFLP